MNIITAKKAAVPNLYLIGACPAEEFSSVDTCLSCPCEEACSPALECICPYCGERNVLLPIAAGQIIPATCDYCKGKFEYVRGIVAENNGQERLF